MAFNFINTYRPYYQHKDGKKLPENFKERMQSRTSVCNFAVTHEDDEDKSKLATLFFNNAPCHASLQNLGQTNTVSYHTSLFSVNKNKPTTEDEQRFLDYILCPETSPWKVILKDRVIHKDKKRGYYAVSIPITDDTNSRVLANLSIATRMTNEYPSSVELWNTLVKEGATELEALFVTTLLEPSEGGYIKKGFLGGHFAFNNNVSYKQMLEGPNYKCNHKYFLFKNSTSYQSCNAIWDGAVETNWIQRDDLYKKLTTAKKDYKGLFPYLYKRSFRNDTKVISTPKEIVETLRGLNNE